MSAGQLGRRLLEEVEEVRFDELLSEIRASGPVAQHSHLSVQTLDQILDIVRRPRISPLRPAWASPQGSSNDGEDDYDLPNTSFEPQSWATRLEQTLPAKLIQLTSSHSAAGKTSLVYSLSALAVLAKRWDGNEAAVVWLDTDGRFSSSRLAQVYARMLQCHSSYSSKIDLDAQVKDGLSHVHVLRPQSSAQLIAMLKMLPDYLLSPDKHHSQQRPLGLVVLDSATAFYWTDRADAEVARLSDPGASAPPSTASQVMLHLKEIETTFECTVILTTDASLQRKTRTRLDPTIRTVAESPMPPQNEHTFQDLWTNFAAVTFDVHRVPVPQFAPAMTIEECTRDQPRRLDALQQGRYRAQFLWTGKESSDLKEDMRKLQNGEGFGFKITTQGVELETP